MKYFYLFILFISIAVLLFCFSGCQEKSELKSIAVTVLQDQTESFMVSSASEKEKIMALFEIDERNIETIGNGGVFRFKPIRNVDYTQSFEYKLASVEYEDVNRGVRLKEIQSFKQGIGKTLDENSSAVSHLNSSSVYLPIIGELERISKLTATKKVIIVFSDLNENVPGGIQSYKEYTKGKEHIKERLRKLSELPGLNGVTIIFQYYPKDELSNARYRIMLGAYEDLLTDKGATVSTEF